MVIKITRKLILLLVALLFVQLKVDAQFATRIVTAEPGNTPGPATVGKRIFQAQHGFVYSEMRLDKPFVSRSTIGGVSTYDSLYGRRNLIQTNVLRYGILERLELRTRLFYNNRKWQAEGNGFFATADVSNTVFADFGARANLLNRAGYSLALQMDVGLSFPNLSTNFTPYAYSMFLLGAKRIKDFLITVNGGLVINEVATDFLVGRASLRYFHEDWLYHIGYTRNQEFAGAANFTTFNNGYFAAIGYFVNNDLMVDVEVSYENTTSREFTDDTNASIPQQILNVGFGISWRLNFRE